MDNKKRSGWLTFLIYAVIAIFSGVIIYSIITNLTNNYRTISTGSLIKLAYDNTDAYEVTDAEIVTNDKHATVNLTVKNSESGNLNYYTVNCDNTLVKSDSSFNNGYDKNIYWSLYDQVVKNNTDSTAHWNSYEYTENVFLSWLPTIISTVVIIGIAIFFFKFLMQSAGGNKQAMDFNKSRARRVDNSKIRFSDVAGCDEEKAEMVEVVDYLKDPKKYTKCGAKLPKGVLLVGPPGTGKTLLAKAVAGEANVPFYSISGSDFVEMFVGVGAGRVRDLFKTAKENAPCLIFIDEIDAVGRQRGAGMGGGNDEREQTLNQLLVELDGFEENSGIIVVAATNRADVLDPALLRAGRFDRQITVNLPNRQGREDIFKVHAKGKQIDPNIDFSALAKRTVGFSGADIANILNEAAILAVRGKRDMVTMADIDEAIDRRIAGPAKSSKGMNEFERKEVAYHEAGHAVIGLTLPNSDKVRKITIIPRGNTGGHVLMGPDDDRFLLSKNELIAEITGLLGGRTSEEIFFNDVTTGASNDIERATQIARSMVVEYGMSSLGPIQYEKDTGSVFLGRDYNNAQRNFSSAVAEEIDKEIRKIIESAHKQATEILTKRKDDVVLIAETLLENETINEEEIDYLLKNRKMPDEKVKQSEAAHSVVDTQITEAHKKEEEAKAKESETKKLEEPKKDDKPLDDKKGDSTK
ncbi:MAG: ATP-dependent zinc metalloprotease FtsH [Bacilli bacterium]